MNWKGADSFLERNKIKINKAVRCIMAIMFLAVMVMIPILHVKDRTVAVVNIFALLSMMLIIFLVSLAYVKWGQGISDTSDKLFALMLFGVYVMAFISAIMVILDGSRRAMTFVYAMRIVLSILSAFLLMMFSWFDQTFIVLPDRQDKAFKKAGMISFVLYAATMLIGARTGWVFDMGAVSTVQCGWGYNVVMLYFICWSLVYGYLIAKKIGFNDAGKMLLTYRGVYLGGMFIFTALVIKEVEVTLYWTFVLFPFISLMIIFCYKFADNSNIILRQQKIIKDRERNLTESQLNSMLLRISPHFISNTLGSVDSLMEDDPGEARKMLRYFSKLLRTNYVDVTDEPMIPFAKEIENLKTYLEIQRMRFPNLKTEFDINADNFAIPNLTLQPLCENAIKHGIRKRPKGAGTLRITSQMDDYSFVIKISDDGVGFTKLTQDDNVHVGIDNVRQRLELMAGGSLDIASEPGKGTECTIIIPKERQE